MKHAKTGKKLNRTKSHRKALFRNLIISLLEKGQIETTLAKAQAVRPIAEKIITKAKSQNLHSRRQVLSFLQKRETVKKLFEEIAPRYQNKKGGYTRIIRTGIRRGDCAPLSILELVETGSEKKA